ncbi:MAG: SdpI family protein [Bacteroidia bacterium]
MKTIMHSEIGETKKRSEWPLIIFMVIPLVYLISIWKTVPDTVPLHFGIDGQADDYGSKWTFVFLSCGIAPFVYLLLYFLPKIDPKRKIKNDSKAFYILRIAIGILISAISCWTIYITTNYNGKMASMRLVPILVSGLMIVMGNYFPTIKQNYFMGIRTPWTLENAEVWTKTHLYSGRAFFYTGFVCLVLSIFLPELISVFLVIGGMLGVSLFGLIYSFVVYKQIQKN